MFIRTKKAFKTNLFFTFVGNNWDDLMIFNTDHVKPLTIAVLGQNIYWVDKRQKNNEVEHLKWRTLDKGIKQIYKKEWAYESTRDLEAVQQNRINGIFDRLNFFFSKFYKPMQFVKY